MTTPIATGGSATFVALLSAEPWKQATPQSIVEDVVIIDASGIVTPEILASLRSLVGSPLPR